MSKPPDLQLACPNCGVFFTPAESEAYLALRDQLELYRAELKSKSDKELEKQ